MEVGAEEVEARHVVSWNDRIILRLVRPIANAGDGGNGYCTFLPMRRRPHTERRGGELVTRSRHKNAGAGGARAAPKSMSR